MEKFFFLTCFCLKSFNCRCQVFLASHSPVFNCRVANPAMCSCSLLCSEFLHACVRSVGHDVVEESRLQSRSDVCIRCSTAVRGGWVGAIVVQRLGRSVCAKISDSVGEGVVLEIVVDRLVASRSARHLRISVETFFSKNI